VQEEEGKKKKMIICDACNRDGVPASPGKRYVFPVRRIDDHGPHEVSDVFSVDLCDGHSREFWEKFRSLIDSYSLPREAREKSWYQQAMENLQPIVPLSAGEVDTEFVAGAGKVPPEAGQGDVSHMDWRPEVGRTYGKAGKKLKATVERIEPAGSNTEGIQYHVRFRDAKMRKCCLSDALFITAYGTEPVDDATGEEPPAWCPEAGKWYGKPGVALAYVDMIDKRGNVRFRDDKSNVGSETPEEFAKFYGMTPVKKG
jgi:hypothetical protein